MYLKLVLGGPDRHGFWLCPAFTMGVLRLSLTSQDCRGLPYVTLDARIISRILVDISPPSGLRIHRKCKKLAGYNPCSMGFNYWILSRALLARSGILGYWSYFLGYWDICSVKLGYWDIHEELGILAMRNLAYWDIVTNQCRKLGY